MSDIFDVLSKQHRQRCSVNTHLTSRDALRAAACVTIWVSCVVLRSKLYHGIELCMLCGAMAARGATLWARTWLCLYLVVPTRPDTLPVGCLLSLQIPWGRGIVKRRTKASQVGVG